MDVEKPDPPLDDPQPKLASSAYETKSDPAGKKEQLPAGKKEQLPAEETDDKLIIGDSSLNKPEDLSTPKKQLSTSPLRENGSVSEENWKVLYLSISKDTLIASTVTDAKKLVDPTSSSSLQEDLLNTTSKMVQGRGREIFSTQNVPSQNVAGYFAMPGVKNVQVGFVLGSKLRELSYQHIVPKKENGFQRENNCENRKSPSAANHSEDDDDDEVIDDDDNEDWSFDEEDDDVKPGRQCPCAFQHPANDKFPLQRQSSNINAPSTSQLHSNPFFSAANVLECTDCEQFFDCRVDLNRHRLKHIADKSFKCSSCDKSFAFSFNLKSHERQHSGEKPYICAECGLSFMHAFHLHEHQRVHNGHSHFVCRICLKSFNAKSKYLVHIQRHSSIKPFKCNVCGKAFHRAAGLRAHELLHSERKEDHPISCQFCDRTFMSMSHKQMHEGMHLSDKRFSCLQCDHTFTEANHLKSHVCLQSIAQKFQCNICKEVFSSLALLNSHAKTHVAKTTGRKNQIQSKFGIFNKKAHTGSVKKRFQCKLCSKGFTNKRLLEEHEKIHQREYTPYMCKECRLTFTHSNYLKLHLLTHQNQTFFRCKSCPQEFVSKDETEEHEETHIVAKRPNRDLTNGSPISSRCASPSPWNGSFSPMSESPQVIRIKSEPP